MLGEKLFPLIARIQSGVMIQTLNPAKQGGASADAADVDEHQVRRQVLLR